MRDKSLTLTPARPAHMRDKSLTLTPLPAYHSRGALVRQAIPATARGAVGVLALAFGPASARKARTHGHGTTTRSLARVGRGESRGGSCSASASVRAWGATRLIRSSDHGPPVGCTPAGCCC